MKQLRLSGGSSVAVVEVPRPEPRPGEVLVRTAVSALCGSEMSTYRGEGKAEGNTGHEAAGTVDGVGEGVTSPAPGARVGLSAISGCGRCEECANGRYTWCADRAFHGSMHAEWIALPARACHVLPDDVPWDTGVLISGDALGVPYHAASKLDGHRVDSVAVFGAGPIGLGHVLLHAHLGRKVLAVDPAAARLAHARDLGAAAVLDPEGTEDVPSAVRDLAGGAPDVCIEAAGRPDAVGLCFATVRTGGVVVLTGEQPAVALSPSEDFIRRDVWAVGAWYYHFTEFQQMLALYRSGLAVDRLITHRFPFEQAGAAYQVMDDRVSGKVLLQY